MGSRKTSEDGMKQRILRVTAIISLVIGLTAISAQAQTFRNSHTFTVPFEFNVGNDVLPAGQYTVFVENQTIRLRNNDGKANAIALAQRIAGAGDTEREVKLTFRRNGDRVYLSTVWLTDGVGRELKRQRRENTDIAQNVIIVRAQTR